MSWWHERPERLERELAALRDAGYKPQPVETGGRMRIKVMVPINGVPQPIEIRYPDLFPLFRFHIYAPPATFARHQGPFDGALCVLGPGPNGWDEDDTAASILATQLPKIEEVNSAGSPRPDLETDQIEPISQYLPTAAGAVLVLPKEAYAIDRAQQSGSLTAVICSEPPGPLRGYVTDIDKTPGTLPDLSGAFSKGTTREIPWRRIAKLPELATPAEYDAALVAIGAIPQARSTERPLSIYGIAFDEEVAYGERPGTGWIFAVRRRVRGNGYQSWLVRAERFEASLQAARLRDIAGLDRKRIAVFGTGALGAPTAHLLLQARVGHLRLIDPDTASLGITVRWPLGYQVVGYPKVAGLSAFAKANYPETTVEEMPWHIGMSHNENDPDEFELLDRAFADVDLVIDATAELDVQHLLAHQARARGITLISVEAREGAYAGRVARFRPTGACRTCLKYHQMDGRFRLPADEQGTVRAAGCTMPTFSGASFDLVPLAATAARMAAQTLVASERYPDTPFDVASLFNRASNAGEIGDTPRWEHAVLEIHPSCPEH